MVGPSRDPSRPAPSALLAGLAAQAASGPVNKRGNYRNFATTLNDKAAHVNYTPNLPRNALSSYWHWLIQITLRTCLNTILLLSSIRRSDQSPQNELNADSSFGQHHRALPDTGLLVWVYLSLLQRHQLGIIT